MPSAWVAATFNVPPTRKVKKVWAAIVRLFWPWSVKFETVTVSVPPTRVRTAGWFGTLMLTTAELRAEPSDDAAVLRELQPGESFQLLDHTLGWAWGYAGDDRRVGYIKSEAIRSD